MVWVRIDDQFAEDPKVVEVGPLGMALQVAALCYANRKLTDGYIPRPIAKTLVDFEVAHPDGLVYDIGVASGMSGQDVQSDWVIDLLVGVGLWHESGHECPDCPPVERGYYIHDFAEYQPSREQVLEKREAARKRKRKSRRKSQDTSQEESQEESRRDDAAGSSPPVPVPEPSAKPSPEGNGKAPFEKRLANELREHHGSQFNARDTLHASFMDLLREALDKLPEDRHHNVSMGVITRFVEEAQGIPISSESRSHTANLVRTHDPLDVLDGYGEALRWGAGIDKQYADDALRLSKYVAGILANRTAA